MKEEVCEINEEVHNTDKPAAVLGVRGAPSILHVPENNRKLRIPDKYWTQNETKSQFILQIFQC